MSASKESPGSAVMDRDSIDALFNRKEETDAKVSALKRHPYRGNWSSVTFDKKFESKPMAKITVKEVSLESLIET